ncbi:nucleotidyltransferase family protein [Actinoplanes sp. NPDC051859]|uniref:nucleotidyltransferase family protein n=1 Tax=Actinoplanes sp. NPDC051859 TaxID=3363909 RepID=UPI003795E506
MTLKDALLRASGRESFDELDSALLRLAGHPTALPPVSDRLYARAESRRVAHLLHDADAGSAGVRVNRRFGAVAGEHHRQTWREVAPLFADAGIRVAGIKGIFLAALLDHPEGRDRITTDLDLLVARDQLEAAQEVLRAADFHSGLDVTDHRFLRMGQRSIAALEALPGSYGQVAPMGRLLKLPELDDVDLARWLPGRKLVTTAEGTRSVSAVDLHYDVGHLDAAGVAHPIPAQDLLEAAVTVRHRGGEVRTLPATTMAWLLSYRAFCDIAIFGERRFKLLADVAELVARGHWSTAVVREATERYPFVTEPIAETLRFLRTECGLTPPADDVRADSTPAPVPQDRRRGTLIVCHGWGRGRDSSPWIRRLRSRLAAYEVTMVEIAPFPAEDDAMPLTTVAALLRREVDEARSLAPDGSVGLLGLSLGSAAALAATISGASVDYVVTAGTVLGDAIGPVDGTPRALLARPTAAGESIPFLTGRVGRHFLEDLIAAVPRDVEALEPPVLVLRGGRDDARRLTDGQTLAKTSMAHNATSAVRDLPAGEHYLDNVPIGAAAAVVDWLRTLGHLADDERRQVLDASAL